MEGVEKDGRPHDCPLDKRFSLTKDQTVSWTPASLTKFQGVPCQEVGGVGAVHI